MSQDLLYDFIGAPNQERALWTPLCVEPRTSDRSPSPFFPDVRERTSVAGKEIVGGLLRSRCDITERVHADLQSIA